MKTISAIPDKQLRKKERKKFAAQNLVNFWYVYKEIHSFNVRFDKSMRNIGLLNYVGALERVESFLLAP